MPAPVIGTKGAELDLLIRQGATFGPNTCTLTNPNATPVNLTGATLRAQIRKTATSTLVPGATGTFVITNAANGVFTWEFTAAVTQLLTADNDSEAAAASTYVWDMELQDASGRVIPLCYGKVNVFREVTKDAA
jgi:hypothetical protein